MSQSSSPLVSIIIPCFNTGKFVRETIQSVIDQSYKNLEIIVVDDGSTDNSKEEILALEDKRIQYIHQENQGLSAARNTGIRVSAGEFINFLDADDLLFSNKIETQLNWLLENPQYDILSCGFIRTNEAGQELYQVTSRAKEIKIDEVLLESPFIVHTAIIRKEIIEKVGYFDTTLRAAEDWDYWCRSSIHGAKIFRLQEPLCTYRLLDNAMTSNATRQTEMLLKVIEKSFTNPLLSPSLHSLHKKAKALVLLRGAARCLVLNFQKEGLTYLKKCIKIQPNISQFDFDPLVQKIAGMFVHMNIKDVPTQVENISQYLKENINVPTDFDKKLLFRIEVLKNNSLPWRTLLPPSNWKYVGQLVLRKVLPNIAGSIY